MKATIQIEPTIIILPVCAKCGNDLTVLRYNSDEGCIELQVEPCVKCSCRCMPRE